MFRFSIDMCSSFPWKPAASPLPSFLLPPSVIPAQAGIHASTPPPFALRMPDGADPMIRYQPGDPRADVIGPLRDNAPEESLYYLNPLPYSKLQ